MSAQYQHKFAQGTSEVQVLRNKTEIYIYNNAAKVLFDSLDVTAIVEDGQSFKEKDNVVCEKDANDETLCIIILESQD